MLHVIKRKIPGAARIVLGLVFTVFGLNGFFHVLPQPPAPPDAAAYLGALAATGYFFPLLKGVEVVAGILLLSGRYVPLALTLLAPIIVNIFAFHLFLAPGGLAIPLVVVLAELVVAWAYRDSFRALLAPNARPRSGDEVERGELGREAISQA